MYTVVSGQRKGNLKGKKIFKTSLLIQKSTYEDDFWHIYSLYAKNTCHFFLNVFIHGKGPWNLNKKFQTVERASSKWGYFVSLLGVTNRSYSARYGLRASLALKPYMCFCISCHMQNHFNIELKILSSDFLESFPFVSKRNLLYQIRKKPRVWFIKKLIVHQEALRKTYQIGKEGSGLINKEKRKWIQIKKLQASIIFS